MGKKEILKNDENCAGCMLCVLSCSLFNFGVFSTEKSFIKLDKDDRTQRFTLSFDDGCISCGECVKSCKYNALMLKDEDSRN